MSAGLSDCPYYRGDGTCIYGCWDGGPACIVDEPKEGWTVQSDHWWVRAWARLRFKIREMLE